MTSRSTAIRDFIEKVEQHFPFIKLDLLCGNCGRPESKHAMFGDFCPDTHSKDQLFRTNQRFSPSFPMRGNPGEVLRLPAGKRGSGSVGVGAPVVAPPDPEVLEAPSGRVPSQWVSHLGDSAALPRAEEISYCESGRSLLTASRPNAERGSVKKCSELPHCAETKEGGMAIMPALICESCESESGVTECSAPGCTAKCCPKCMKVHDWSHVWE
jgi:hypothetical protein